MGNSFTIIVKRLAIQILTPINDKHVYRQRFDATLMTNLNDVHFWQPIVRKHY